MHLESATNRLTELQSCALPKYFVLKEGSVTLATDKCGTAYISENQYYQFLPGRHY